ncbi:hypothetical protein E1B28_009320 [Marasmius oreades]|uniref:Fungal-type protein kinase domain-containing protein n=1 Tax=Marasmius oreades TaxID=181124 RepID=A0A9P7S060_9AGAR|nr:uncharacterized protein E1B28_009320 [Marasmius oreades]KAG7093024.1 hypothetical protein E1B28_009320 [Marasmius oreades]
MATYAGAILWSQFRTHLFSIQVTRTRARLIRWDREGAVVTSSFTFAEEPYLVEFVKRYGDAVPEDRGHGRCVEEVEDAAVVNKVREALQGHLNLTGRVYQFTFPNERDRNSPAIYYGIAVPSKGTACPTGRSTRGFIVVDVKAI